MSINFTPPQKLLEPSYARFVIDPGLVGARVVLTSTVSFSSPPPHAYNPVVLTQNSGDGNLDLSLVQWIVFGGSPEDRQTIFHYGEWLWELPEFPPERAPLCLNVGVLSADRYCTVPKLQDCTALPGALSGAMSYDSPLRIPPHAKVSVILSVPRGTPPAACHVRFTVIGQKIDEVCPR